MKNQKKMVLEPFFRHHPKRNWGTPVWQNGAWFPVKKHVFLTFFHGFVILGQLVISSIYHEWTCLLDFVVRHRHTYNRARFEGKKCRTFSYMLKCVQFCCPKVNQCPFLRRCGTIPLLFKVVPELGIYRLENKKNIKIIQWSGTML